MTARNQRTSRRLGPAPGRGVLRDVVLGTIDGSVTTIAIVAGVHGAGLPPAAVVALGFANVAADGFSMAAGNYSGAKAERDNHLRIRRMQEAEIDRDPDGQRHAARAILSRKGLGGDVLDAATDQVTAERETWVALMLEGAYGVSGPEARPLHVALATFLAFLVAGIVPLLPFILSLSSPFATAAAVTALTFFTIGAVKSRWSLDRWWRSGLETLLIGGTAALIAYGAGTLFHV